MPHIDTWISTVPPQLYMSEVGFKNLNAKYVLFFNRKTARNFNQPMCKAAKITIVEVGEYHIARVMQLFSLVQTSLFSVCQFLLTLSVSIVINWVKQVLCVTFNNLCVYLSPRFTQLGFPQSLYFILLWIIILKTLYFYISVPHTTLLQPRVTCMTSGHVLLSDPVWMHLGRFKSLCIYHVVHTINSIPPLLHFILSFVFRIFFSQQNKLLVSSRSLKFFPPHSLLFISFLSRALFKHLPAYQICFYPSLCSKRAATNKRLIKRHFQWLWTNSINESYLPSALFFLRFEMVYMWINNYWIWTIWADISVTSLHAFLSVYQ